MMTGSMPSFFMASSVWKDLPWPLPPLAGRERISQRSSPTLPVMTCPICSAVGVHAAMLHRWERAVPEQRHTAQRPRREPGRAPDAQDEGHAQVGAQGAQVHQLVLCDMHLRARRSMALSMPCTMPLLSADRRGMASWPARYLLWIQKGALGRRQLSVRAAGQALAQGELRQRTAMASRKRGAM